MLLKLIALMEYDADINFEVGSVDVVIEEAVDLSIVDVVGCGNDLKILYSNSILQ